MLSGGERRHLQPRLTEPSSYDASATPRVLTVLSCVLEKLVARNDQLSGGGYGKRLSAFHGVRSPAIGLDKYVERIYKYTSCSPSCFVVAFVYIDRLLHRYPDSLVVSLNVHRLLVTSVMIASKTLDDEHYNNAFYARVGGVSNSELNKLELELLFLLDFDVTVSSRIFESYCQHLEKEMLCNDLVERLPAPGITISVDDVTEISVGDAQTSSPPILVDS
ncbi:cyclin-U1-1-like [Salvia miltiorrhiza]|uniref:cyclin-U1-1-like n=1 Tax=Salvia miltiorrhiza TaxID=226208 RepID=UPI0025AC2C7D|nr:cyclin-U1-1-like [Salvia miltiorrhiza]